MAGLRAASPLPWCIPLSSEYGTSKTVKARLRPLPRPDSGLGVEVKVLTRFKWFPLGSVADGTDGTPVARGGGAAYC